MVGHSQEQGHGGRLFPCRPQSRMVGCGRVDLRLEHRLGTRGGAGRVRRHRRRGDGPFRAPCLVPAGAGLGLRPLLRPLDGLHHAGVPGAAVFARLALRAVRRVAGHVHRLQDRGGHLRRRRGVPHAAAGNPSFRGRDSDQQLLDRLDPRARVDRPVHQPGRNAGRGLQRLPCRPSFSSSARRC